MKKRGRRRRKGKLFAATVLVLAIAIIVLAFGLLFYVQKIEITGNDYTDDKVILEMIEGDKLSFNSVYDVVKFRFADPDLPGSLASAKVKMKNPWTLKVEVKEKEIIGSFTDGEENVYFDSEGVVVLKSKEAKAQVPCIEGVDVKSAKLYETLKLENEKMLEAVVSVAQQVKNYDLTPDRILYTDSGIELYFGDICVMLGTDVTAEKIAQITPILEKLNGQAGTLHLERYGEESDTITFKKAAEEATDDSSESDDASSDGSDDSYDESYDDSYDESYDDSGYSDDYYDESYEYYDDTDEY